MERPTVVVVGLGPGDPGLLTVAARAAIDATPARFLRTARHPSAHVVGAATAFDAVYEAAATVEEVYVTIASTLAAAAVEHGRVLYAVPGSPLVAEQTVELLRADARVEVELLPAVSFLDLAWARLGVDPVAAGARTVDGHRFAVEAAGSTGPLLVGQCDRVEVLSAVKLAVDDDPGPVTVLQRLGLPDEAVFEVAWADLDRSFVPDHLTSVWIPTLAAPVAGEIMALLELVRTLRDRCPWDRVQTHRSLARHLLEETYELLDAIDDLPAGAGAAARPPVDSGSAPAGARRSLRDRRSRGRRPRWGLGVGPGAGSPAAVVVDAGDAAWDHLEEELGDLLFQVAFHAILGSEAGRFGLADVARGVHDKLVARHPHVFGDVDFAGVEDLAAGWEQRKKREKGRASVMEGIPATLPSLLYADKVQRKATALGLDWPDADGVWAKVAEELGELRAAVDDASARPATAADGPGGGGVGEAVAEGPGGGGGVGEAVAGELGDVLFTVVNLGRKLGVDPEMALRGATARFAGRVQAVEAAAAAAGVDPAGAPADQLDAWWEQAKAGG